jgi:hypothetical protein
MVSYGLFSISNAQHYSRAHDAHAGKANGQQEQPLQLTTSIISQRYCKNDKSSLVLQLNLGLVYTNVGYQPLILYKGSKLIHRHTTSSSIQDAQAKRFISDFSLSIYTASDVEVDESSVDNLFVVLQPGATYEREALNVVALPVLFNATEASRPALSPGEYVLQVRTSTWPESIERARELRTKWMHSGFLWYNTVTSRPMPFRVKKPDSAAKCS